MRPAEMAKITVTGPKTAMPVIIEKLHDLKVFHIIDHVKQDDIDIGTALPIAEQLSEIIIKIRSICSYLNIDLSKEPDLKKIGIFKKSDYAPYNLGKISRELFNQVTSSLDKIKELNERVTDIKILIPELEALDKMGLSPEDLHGYDSLSVFFGKMNKKEDIIKNLNSLKNASFEITENKGATYLALFAEKKDEKKAQDILVKNGFSQSPYFLIFSKESSKEKPEVKLSGSAGKNMETLSKELVSCEKKIQSINKELEDTGSKYESFLILNEKLLSRELEKVEAPLKFADFPSAFIATGWVPAERLNQVSSALNKSASGRIHIDRESAYKGEKIPVDMRNKGLVKPFEWLMEIYTLPKYREIDPTFLTFLTFPIFFGFILGDFGYGLTTLAIFLLLKRKIKSPLIDVLIVASISSIVFGFLFGEFFGEEMLFGYHLPHVLSRVHELNELLMISLIIGIAHINFGLILGFINELSHGFWTAFSEKISWILLQIGAALIAFRYIKGDALSLYAGIIMVLIAAILIVKSEGLKGALEIPAIFGNILSYARLMAVGVASVSLALIVNTFAFDFFHQGGLMIIAGILILVIGHLINIGLGIIGGFLHSIRLHYVEFFSKFYKGGGAKYVPFGQDK